MSEHPYISIGKKISGHRKALGDERPVADRQKKIFSHYTECKDKIKKKSAEEEKTDPEEQMKDAEDLFHIIKEISSELKEAYCKLMKINE